MLLLCVEAALISLVFVQTKGANPKEGDSCLQVIKAISEHDEKFTCRFDDKKKILADMDKKTKKNLKPAELSAHINNQIGLNGNYNRCGATADWVADVLRGTTAESVETDGFKDYAGEAIKKHFEKHAKDKEKHIVFLLSLASGIGAGHDWVIYQLPHPSDPKQSPVYLIFQSYIGAYTLEAWLTPMTTAPGALTELKKRVSFSWITKCGKSKGKAPGCDENDLLLYEDYVEILTEDLANLKKQQSAAEKVKSWQSALDYVEGKNPNQPFESFETAWKLYGGGKLLTKMELFEDQTKPTYVSKLVEVLAWSNVAASKPISVDNAKQYSELFGATMASTFPGLPKDLFNIYRPSKLSIKTDKVKEKKTPKVNAACVAEGLRVIANLNGLFKRINCT